MPATRLALVLVASVAIAAACTTTKRVDLPWPTGTPAPTGPTPCPSPLWRAGLETGDTSEWTADGGGGPLSYGNATSAVVTGTAHTGTHALALQISPPPISGYAWDRRAEGATNDDLFYSTWVMLPKQTQMTGVFWAIGVWHAIPPATLDLVSVDVQPDAAGSPNSHLHTYATYSRQGFDAPFDVPQGTWFRLDVLYRCRRNATSDGQVVVWQDGVLAYEADGIVTGTNGRPCGWYLSNASDGVSPTPARVWFDDASISANCGL